MASTISLKVKVDKTEFAAFKTQLDALTKKPVEIKIKFTGLNELKELSKSLETSAKRLSEFAVKQGQATKAEAELMRQSANLTRETKNLVKANNELAVSQEKTRQSQERTKQAQERTTQALERTKQAQEQTTQALERTKQAQERTTQTLVKAETATNSYARSSKSLMQTIMNSQVALYAYRTAMYGVIGAFKSALNTIKEVDTAVTHFRQVTGASNEEGTTLGKSAYTVASQYGASAADYVESIATYARAGYRETAEALAELSLKTQIAGQTTAEISNQFILAMDKAYGFEGSVTKLTEVLDGASKIDSTYATTIEKIAQGLGIVAPLAAQMHVSEQELTAAIGTITAVTQRSGSEAARALRSLFLNIMKDMNTEIEEGKVVSLLL